MLNNNYLPVSLLIRYLKIILLQNVKLVRSIANEIALYDCVNTITSCMTSYVNSLHCRMDFLADSAMCVIITTWKMYCS